MAVHVRTTTGLECILQKLEQKLPDTALIFCMTKNLLQDKYLFYSLWVDNYPDFYTIAIVANSQSTPNTYYEQQIFVFDAGIKVPSTLFDNPMIINWNAAFIFNGLTLQTHKKIERYLKQTNGHVLKPTKPDLLYTSSNIKDIIEAPVPDNVKVRPMTPETADKANSLGMYGGEGSYEYFRDLVRLKQISVCLYHPESDEPIGWAIQHMNGELGNLYVDPKYRRKGFGKYIMSTLVKKAIVKDGHAFVFVESDNDISQALQESIGLKRVMNNGYIWQKYRMQH